MDFESETAKRLEAFAMPKPSEELKRRVLADAKAALRKELENEAAFKGSLKFLFACAALFAALLIGSHALAGLIAKAPADAGSGAMRTDALASSLEQFDESLARRSALLERIALERRSGEGPGILESRKALLELDARS